MVAITTEAYAKINLWLTVGGRRADGYHEIETVMQRVSLCDLVSVVRRPDPEGRKIAVHCSDPAVPTDERNLAWKCAEAFFRACGIERYNIFIDIEKHIPQAAGLAGGSADGAATLALLNRLFRIRAPREVLCSIGGEVGADIPFCVSGHSLCLCRGKGEILTPVGVSLDAPRANPLCSCAALIVKDPALSVSTGEAYRRLDKTPPDPSDAVFRETGLSRLLDEIGNGRVPTVLCNDFERVAPAEVFPLKEKIRSLGALSVLMSGSGPSVYGLFPRLRDAEAARDVLAAEGFGAWAAQLV